MGLSVCPSAIVAAPVEMVWSLLDPLSQLGTWAEGEVISVEPEGPATPGQRMIIRSRALGRTWKVTFVVEEVHSERHMLQTNVTFPFGMHLHERIMCNPIDAISCRVQYG
jgi:hypothetical protein